MGKKQNTIDTLTLAWQWLRLAAPRRRVRRSGRGKGHLALFAHCLPPCVTGGVYRPLSFIRYGVQLGWRVDAFHGPVEGGSGGPGDELLRRVPPGTRLHGVPPSPLVPSYRLTPQIDGSFKNAVQTADFAVRALAADPPQVVLASGPPFHMFVAALLVARRFRVPLVLDYRDEWSECPFPFVDNSGRSNRRWERKCLAAASAVLFTTASHLHHQVRTFSELDPGRAYLVPNGWEPDEFPSGPEAVGEPARHHVVVAHVGQLGPHNPPTQFLAAVAELLREQPVWKERLTVVFVGGRSGAVDTALRSFPFPEQLQVVDRVGKNESVQLMCGSDVLLLLAQPELERYLPGKLFDYIAARRPVLVYGQMGEAARAVLDLGVGVLCRPGSGDALRAALEELAVLDLESVTPRVSEWLQRHRRDILAGEAFEIMARIMGRADDCA